MKFGENLQLFLKPFCDAFIVNFIKSFLHTMQKIYTLLLTYLSMFYSR